MKKIILADNQSIFLAGVTRALATRDDIRVVAQCRDTEHLMNAVRTFHASIIVVASSLHPDLPNLILSAQESASKLIVIAASGESSHTYADHGFDGVVFRDVTGAELVECVNSVVAGQTYLQQKSGGAPIQEPDAVGARVRERLTEKEIKIVGLIVQGYKNKEIGDQLKTTEQVIKNCLRDIYDKTGVSGRLELALFTLYHRTLAEAVVQAGAQVEFLTASA